MEETYKRLGFSAKDIEIYEMPMRDRQSGSTAAKWRKLDQLVFDDLKKCAQPSKHTSGYVGVITDSIETVNPTDGKTYTSKSKYYQSLKNSGSHVIEPGEQGKKRELQGDYNVKAELKQALQQHLGR